MKSFIVGKYSNIFLQSKHKKRFFCIKTLYFVTKLLITHCLKTKKGRCNQSIHTSSFLLTYQTVLLLSRTKKNILSLYKSNITRNSCAVNFIKISLKSRSYTAVFCSKLSCKLNIMQFLTLMPINLEVSFS